MKLIVRVEIEERYRIVGAMETKPGVGGVFTYDEQWAHNGKGKPLSLSLPLEEQEFPGEAMKRYFEGLLPEEQARKAIARELGVSSRSYIRLLAALNDECIGAVVLSNADQEDADEPPTSYHPLTKERFELLAEQEYSLSSEIAAESRLSLAGSQSKVGLYRDPEDGSWWIPRGTAPSNCIVKPNNSRFEGLVDNELFCLRLAQACGIPAAHAEKARTKSPMLIIKRYDRIPSPSGATIDGHLRFCRLHQEDFCQALGILGEDKYEESPRNYAGKMSDLLLKYSSSPAEDIARLFDMFLLNYFIGNCDAHLKNYSLIRSYDWRSLNLAPAYDLVSTTVYPGLTTAMGIYMRQKKKIERIDRDDLTDLAKTMGINAKAANRQIDAMRERLSNALASVPAEESITQAIATQTTKRIKQFAQ